MVLSKDQIELNCVFKLKWIDGDLLFLHLTMCKQNSVLKLNWIVWFWFLCLMAYQTL